VEKGEFSAYFRVLEDTIKKKEGMLEELLALTQKQEEVLSGEQFRMEEFQELMEKKAPLIEKVAAFDSGFEGVYGKIKPTIDTFKAEFEPRIRGLQERIRSVLEKGAQLCALEEQNRRKLEVCLGEKKQEIKNFKRSSQTVSNYYKNMTGSVKNQSFFMDQKK